MYGYVAYDERASRRRDSLANYNDFTAHSSPHAGIVAPGEPVFYLFFFNARRYAVVVISVFRVKKNQVKSTRRRGQTAVTPPPRVHKKG